ncbi:MAG: hypothetical protein ACM3KR_08315 [Deltaproteobacteria bacterium]
MTSAVKITPTDQREFTDSLAKVYKNVAVENLELNRKASCKKYDDVKGFNVDKNTLKFGFKWEDGDEDTEKWRPQGICGFKAGTRDFLAVTWYGREEENYQWKGIRISFIDITDINKNIVNYRHVLLVQTREQTQNPAPGYTQLDLYAPIFRRTGNGTADYPHAGGVAYYDGKLYVSETDVGLLVFNLSQIFQVNDDDIKDRCGMEKDGTLRAFGYKYILPQTGYYEISNAKPFSCVELGNSKISNDRKMLWTGQFKEYADVQDIPAKIYGFFVDENGLCIEDSPEEITPTIDGEESVYGIQGVYRNSKEGKTFMTSTQYPANGNAIIRFIRCDDGKSGVIYPWAKGAEDLHYDESNNCLWNLTEFEKNRCVFAVDLSNYE